MLNRARQTQITTSSNLCTFVYFEFIYKNLQAFAYSVGSVICWDEGQSCITHSTQARSASTCFHSPPPRPPGICQQRHCVNSAPLTLIAQVSQLAVFILHLPKYSKMVDFRLSAQLVGHEADVRCPSIQLRPPLIAVTGPRGGVRLSRHRCHRLPRLQRSALASLSGSKCFF